MAATPAKADCVMRVRRFSSEDAPAISELYVRSVRTIGVRHYSAAQAEAWAARAPSAARFCHLAADGRTTLVAVNEADAPMGFIDLEPDGHIHFLYCRAGSGRHRCGRGPLRFAGDRRTTGPDLPAVCRSQRSGTPLLREKGLRRTRHAPVRILRRGDAQLRGREAALRALKGRKPSGLRVFPGELWRQPFQTLFRTL